MTNKTLKKMLIMVGMLSLLALATSAWSWNYGRLSASSYVGKSMTISQLYENWDNYHIYYAGPSLAWATAIMFDPKDDKRKVVTHKWWEAVKDREMLFDLVGMLEGNVAEPSMLKVVGPDDRLYGYIYTPYNHAYIKKIDEKTLWIDEMTTPPSFNGLAG